MTKRAKIECKEPCVCCGAKAVYHHIKAFGAGGSNHINNLMPLCFKHHHQAHKYGNMKMCRTYFAYQESLIEKGWEVSQSLGKWVNYEPEITR